MKIGIIGAMETEVAALKEAMETGRTEVISDMTFHEGLLHGREVVVVQCGVGKVNAAICTQTLIREFGATHIINTGVAGSLNNQIDIGDFVICVDAVQHDFNVASLGFANGEIPYTGIAAFKADPLLREKAVEAVRTDAPDHQVFEGRVCSGDQFIFQISQKEEILRNFGGDCCEMEGAAIAQVCHLNHTPFVIIRAISDKPDGSVFVDFPEFSKEAAASCARIVCSMVAHF
ncbi:MAG TPA: 5'-methylthioadenosine/adenosylhomocysteine nucleosidase [Lachnospiraceae bacterium]|nr:5'-methylthioadenosine/adenosylhomocysteine nucleosidase [Lachnospiraceae bacterium]